MFFNQSKVVRGGNSKFRVKLCVSLLESDVDFQLLNLNPTIIIGNIISGSSICSNNSSISIILHNIL